MTDDKRNPHSDTSDDPNEPGAEGGESEATHRPPGAPAKDDSPRRHRSALDRRRLSALMR